MDSSQHATRGGPAKRWTAVSFAAVGLMLSVLVAACVPPGPPAPTTTTTTSVAPDPNAVEGVQLSWSYSQYAQYGVFGQWSQTASGPNVQVTSIDGQVATGLATEAGKSYLQAQFDHGVGSIDPVTGEGTITWDTGDWVLNAYSGLFGAPDETLRDPVLDIEADGSGTLSFEAFIPEALDMAGNPAGSSGPTRIAIATFSSVELGADGLKVTPDFAGRSYTPVIGTPWNACPVGGVDTGGSWPAEWIDFLPTSVQAHYYSTGCSGLQLRKPPTPFYVDWDTSPGGIVTQPALTTTTAYAGASLASMGARVAVTGRPLPSIQWQRSFDGVTWTDIDGAVNTALAAQLTPADDGASFRALVAGESTDVLGPVTVNTSAPNIQGVVPSVTVGQGELLQLTVGVLGAPVPEITWERSDDGGATWTEVVADGADVIIAEMAVVAPPTSIGGMQSILRYNPATASEDGARFRVRTTNGVGDPVEVVSAETVVTVALDMPTITSQPADTMSFEGQRATFNVQTGGLPAPTRQWQRSTDGGATWQDIAGATATTLAVEAVDMTTALDQSLYRAEVTNAAGTVHSREASLGVVALTGGPQIAVFPSAAFDPTQPVRLNVIGAGFTPPAESGNLRMVITDASKWQPGQDGNTVGALYNIQRTKTTLANGGGYFRDFYDIPANTFADESLSYGFATFGATVTDRWYDTWTPIAIDWPMGED